MTSTPRSATGHSVPTWVYLTALAAVTLVSRLPQLLSPNLLLEGDECILGLMAMHLAGGHEFPVFFYGQKYGLSIVEAPAAALNFVIFGVGALPLKLAMLGIWIVGILFYFLAFSSVLGATRSFWITWSSAPRSDTRQSSPKSGNASGPTWAASRAKIA